MRITALTRTVSQPEPSQGAKLPSNAWSHYSEHGHTSVGAAHLRSLSNFFCPGEKQTCVIHPLLKYACLIGIWYWVTAVLELLVPGSLI